MLQDDRAVQDRAFEQRPFGVFGVSGVADGKRGKIEDAARRGRLFQASEAPINALLGPRHVRPSDVVRTAEKQPLKL
jgi:hypothetical protein